MAQLTAYLSFDGNCTEAMRFYERSLGGKLEGMIKFGDAPADFPVPPGSNDRIMHSSLTLPGGAVLMAGDTPKGMPYQGMTGMALALTYLTADEAKTAFATLAEDGKVNMAMAPSFWAEAFGMVVDRFGTPWLVNGGMKM